MNQNLNDKERRTPRLLTAPVEITSESETEDETLYNLVFYIRDYIHLPDGSQVIRAFGTHKKVAVGLDVVLNSIWQKNLLGKYLPILSYTGTVTYHSLGAASDTLVSTLDELYGTQLDPVGMANNTQFTSITLDGDPLNLKIGPTKLKLFFHGTDEDTYAELYTDIYLAEHRLELLEKDYDYRTALVKALSRQ